jgi:hypothetical protein
MKKRGRQENDVTAHGRSAAVSAGARVRGEQADFWLDEAAISSADPTQPCHDGRRPGCGGAGGHAPPCAAAHWISCRPIAATSAAAEICAANAPAPAPAPTAESPGTAGDHGPFACAGGPCPSPTVACGYLSAACDSAIGKYHVTLTDADGFEVRAIVLAVLLISLRKRGALPVRQSKDRPARPGQPHCDDPVHLQRLVRGQVLHHS